MFEAEVFRKVNYLPFKNKGRAFYLSDYPYLDIVMNDNCNARCKFCIGRLVHRQERPTLDSQKAGIKYAIDTMGVKEVLLLGGEPTINNTLFDYVHYLKTNFNLKKICLTTNAHRMAKDPSYAEQLFSSGITHVNISYMSTDPDKQKYISGTNLYISPDMMRRFKRLAELYGVHIRVNNNVFVNNHDTVGSMIQFYAEMMDCCHSLKFSPLLKTDSFSTVNEVTEFNSANILSDEKYDSLWHGFEAEYFDHPIVRNPYTFGFVEYSMILAPTPIILNYNHHGKLRQKVLEGYVNNLKMLPTADLSLSWNREEKDYFIDIN